MAKKTLNRLAREKSPYLLQHADNPVDWLPWGEEAFEKARSEGKPIFLSIGYSTCHWCHVMERESFQDAGIAEVLNRSFVPVKVDREERPDVDKVYMTIASGAGWGGGWPLSVWMTPDRKPFFGGTYFPPESRWGRPGFKEILERISEVWDKKRDAVAEDAARLAEAFRRHARTAPREADFDPAWLDKAFRDFKAAFDEDEGGFSQAPKFPMPVNQAFLLRYWARTGEEEALAMVRKTLGRMAAGGIYDHLGGGFARYSVDGRWRVPHFEKMLYDNAQLAVNYLEAYQAAKDPGLAVVARETLDYVLRDMTHPEGGFYSAEDADSPLPEEPKRKGEGAFYLWSKDEIELVLGPKAAAVFCRRYGVEAGGNALEDPHGEFTGKNILYAAGALEETARESGATEREAARLLDEARAKLLAARSRRPRPHLDDKVLASWNGLMISAFAKGYAVLEDPRYLQAAQKAARFLRAKAYDPGSGTLYHRWREGERAVPGLADDYAFLLAGLLDLYEASFDPDWLDWAVELGDALLERFEDRERGGFYMTAEGEGAELPARVMEDSDNVEPAAGSAAALGLARLAQLAGRPEFREAAERAVRRFGGQMRDFPRSLPAMLAAGDFLSAKPGQIVLAGEPGDPGIREMLRAARSRFLPTKVLLLARPGPEGERLRKRLPFIKGMVPIGGKATAYVCVDFACELPTTDPAKVAELLK